MSENTESALPTEDVIESVINELETGTEPTEESAEESAESTEVATETEATEDPAQDQPPVTTERTQLLAEQMALLADREQKLRDSKTAQEQAIQAAREEARRELVDLITRDPMRFIEEAKIEKPGDLAMYFYQAELGDEAPEELKARTAKTEVDRKFYQQQKEIADLKSLIMQQETRAQAQAVLNDQRTFIEKADVTEFPHLSKLDRAEVLQAMADATDKIIEAQGRLPTAAEVAKLLEAEVAKVVAPFSTHSTAETLPPDRAKTTKQPTTISDDLSDRSADATPEEDLDDRITALVSELQEEQRPRKIK